LWTRCSNHRRDFWLSDMVVRYLRKQTIQKKYSFHAQSLGQHTVGAFWLARYVLQYTVIWKVDVPVYWPSKSVPLLVSMKLRNKVGIPWTEYRLGSSDFGTLTYFKQIWIAVKILRSNYKICFSLYLPISCENGIFVSKIVRSSLYKVRNFFSWNRSIWVSKDPHFYADFKNVNTP
jgi:hypothetical protein